VKKLGWLLFLAAFNLSAQTVIVNPPLSLEPESGRQMVEDAPVDGNLKLDNKKSEDVSATSDTTTDKLLAVTPKIVEPKHNYLLEKYLQFSFGYLNSNWKKADPSLGDGSTLTDFRVVSDMNQHGQFGFAIEMISGNSNEAIPDNIRVLQYKIFIDHHRALFTDKLDWIVGLSLSLGDYSIRKLGLNGSGEVVSTKIKNGTIFGIIPSAGIRFYLGGQNSLDIGAEYHHYLSKPQSYIGGFAFVPRFSFVY
jgi:hypothetical protein